jgi:hypothetical protein
MNLILELDVTEYNVMPNRNNETNIIHLYQDSMVINLMDSTQGVIEKTEVSSEDAIKLAKFILQFYAIQNR